MAENKLEYSVRELKTKIETIKEQQKKFADREEDEWPYPCPT